MSAKQDTYRNFTYLRRRSRNAWLTSLFSITLVLYFLGLFFALLMFGSSFLRNAATIEMRVFLHDGIGEVQQQKFEDWLTTTAFVKAMRYVSKDEAAQILLERSGEDVKELMQGINPLLASYHLQLRPQFLQPDSLQSVKTEIEGHLIVASVEYPGESLALVRKNLTALSVIFGMMAIILLLIAFFLITSTIRLTIFARRLVIRSMQLIGATRNFIRRPFVWQGFLQGSLAGIMAGGLILLSLRSIQWYLREQGLFEASFSTPELIGLLGGIVLFGLILGLSGSYFAVNKFLNRNLDELM
jgi:cell division transport system permease protein